MVTNSCVKHDNLPRKLAGAISKTYTVIVDIKSPSPSPVTQRPTSSIGRFSAALDNIEPTPKTRPPRAKVRVREIRSERGPAAMEDNDAVRRMVETIRPWRIAEMESNLSSNWDITVTGPIDPEIGVKR